jgi:hypothetical protein
LKSQGSVKDESTLDEGSLVWANDPVGDRVQFKSKSLGDNLEDDVDECYGSILRNFVCPGYLRDERESTP